MFKIDDEKKIIYLTRGDDAAITFSAKDDEGNEFHPTVKDRLIFSVGKRWNDEPIFVISNEMEESEEAFWLILIKPEHTKSLPVTKFNFDVQLERRNNTTGDLEFTNTIIGKTEEINPQFILWGEMSE